MDLEKLAKLKELKDNGVITQEEFEAQKAKILAEDGGATPKQTKTVAKKASASTDEELPKLYRWFSFNKVLDGIKKENNPIKYLKTFGWILALFPIVWFMVALLLAMFLSDDAYNTMWRLCNLGASFGYAYIIATDILVIRYYMKQKWIMHPVGIFVSTILLGSLTAWIWCFLKAFKYEGDASTKQMFMSQAIIFSVLMVIVIAAGMKLGALGIL